MAEDDDASGKQDAVLECHGVTKRFGATVALADVSLALEPGETRALLGENGAGKSTLIRILAGNQPPDSGTLRYRRQEVTWKSPLEARAAGIAVVHQELSLVAELTVAENIFLGQEERSGLGLLRLREMQERTAALFEELGITGIRPGVPIRQLSPSQRQLVEIAKAINLDPTVLVLDEPTSTLGGAMVEWLLDQVARWCAKGVAIAFTSHRMAEIISIADSITVLRGGRVVLDAERGEASESELISAMSGRQVDVGFPALSEPRSAPVLSVEHLSGQRWPRDASLKVAAGEIVGIGGLDGQGQRELLLGIYGLLRAKGAVRVGSSKPISRRNASKMRELGVGFVPADRGQEGLLQHNSIAFNVALPWLKSFSSWSILQRARLLDSVGAAARRLSLSTESYETSVSALSGGNQQKIVLAKWLLERPRLLILYDVTRGIDIGTKIQIYNLLAELARTGVGILLYTTDLNELVNLSHRVYVMFDGAIVAELDRSGLTEERVLAAAFASTDAPRLPEDQP